MLLNKRKLIVLILSLSGFSYVHAVKWTLNITNNKNSNISIQPICLDSESHLLQIKPYSSGTCYAFTKKGVNPYSPEGWPDNSYYPIQIESVSSIGSVLIDDISNNTGAFNNLASWHPIFFNNSFAAGYFIVSYEDQNQIQLKSITINNNNEPVVDIFVNDAKY
jgi:hypothetical protein